MYQINDIVQSNAAYGGKIFVITEVKPRGGYIGKACYGTNKTFNLKADSIACKIGTAIPDSPFLTGMTGGDDDNAGQPVVPQDFQRGQDFAAIKAGLGGPDVAVWNFLSNLEFGDPIQLVTGDAAIYQGCKGSRPKFPVSYKKGTRNFKCPAGYIRVPQ